MGALVAGAITIVALLVVGGVGVFVSREPGRRVRRKHLAAAHAAVNDIDDIVDRYHPQLDIVGQAMAADIRQVISKHRKDIVSR
jgi:hypothetical protein